MVRMRVVIFLICIVYVVSKKKKSKKLLEDGAKTRIFGLFGSDDFDYAEFNTKEDIFEEMKKLESSHSASAKVFGLPEKTPTLLVNKNWGIRINEAGESKKGKSPIVITAGMTARDWIAPAAMIYFVKECLETKDVKIKSDVKKLLKKHTLFIIPLANPEGYYYSYKNDDKDWVKSRRQVDNGCQGVNLNRNFGVGWGEKGDGLKDPCSNNYAGNGSTSESETRNIARYMALQEYDFFGKTEEVISYWNIHGGGPAITYPYGYTKSTMRWEQYTKLPGEAFVRAANKRYNTGYKLEKLSDRVLAGGQASDYARYQKSIYYTYDVFLRSGNNPQKKWIVEPEDIKKAAEEFADGFFAAVNLFKD